MVGNDRDKTAELLFVFGLDSEYRLGGLLGATEWQTMVGVARRLDA